MEQNCKTAFARRRRIFTFGIISKILFAFPANKRPSECSVCAPKFEIFDFCSRSPKSEIKSECRKRILKQKIEHKKVGFCFFVFANSAMVTWHSKLFFVEEPTDFQKSAMGPKTKVRRRGRSSTAEQTHRSKRQRLTHWNAKCGLEDFDICRRRQYNIITELTNDCFLSASKGLRVVLGVHSQQGETLRIRGSLFYQRSSRSFGLPPAGFPNGV